MAHLLDTEPMAMTEHDAGSAVRTGMEVPVVGLTERPGSRVNPADRPAGAGATRSSSRSIDSRPDMQPVVRFQAPHFAPPAGRQAHAT